MYVVKTKYKFKKGPKHIFFNKINYAEITSQAYITKYVWIQAYQYEQTRCLLHKILGELHLLGHQQ